MNGSRQWLSEHSGHHAATLRPMEDPQFNYLPMWMQSIKELGCEALQGPKWENVRKRLQELTPSFEIQPEGVRALIQPTTVSTQNGGNDELSDDAAEEEEDDESTKTGEKREKEKMKKKKKEKKEMMMVKIPDSAFKTASGGFPELDLLSRLIIRIQHFTLLPLCVVAGRVNFYFESWAYAIRHLVIADIIGMALYWMWCVSLLVVCVHTNCLIQDEGVHPFFLLFCFHFFFPSNHQIKSKPENKNQQKGIFGC